MKKTVSIILIIGIIITMFCGCSDKIVGREFSSKEAMLNYLRGTWIEVSTNNFEIWTFKENGYASMYSTVTVNDDNIYIERQENNFNYKNGTFGWGVSTKAEEPEIVIKESGVFAIFNNDPEKLSELYKLSDSASLGNYIAKAYEKFSNKANSLSTSGDIKMFKGEGFTYGGADNNEISFIVEYYRAGLDYLIAARTDDYYSLYSRMKNINEGAELNKNLLVAIGKSTGTYIAANKPAYELLYYLYITDSGEILTNIN